MMVSESVDELAWSRIESPLGAITMTASPRGLVGLQFDASEPDPSARRDDAALRDVAGLVEAYFAGDLTSFDVPLDLRGTTFQMRAWAALCAIPYGTTRSYSEQAEFMGSPGSSRAVGVANSRNPIAIIVPCHRVIGKNHSLTGYAGGLERKAFLLNLEQRRSFATRRSGGNPAASAAMC